MPGHNDYITLAHRKQFGEIGRKGGVGLSLFRRRCDADPRPTRLLAQKARPGSAGHDLDRKYDGRTLQRQLKHVDILQDFS